MISILKLCLLCISLIILVSVAWRLLSQRVSLPCPSWLSWLVELDNPFAKVCHAKFIVEKLDLSPGMKVLDVGAGAGRVTIPLAEKLGQHGQVTAMDIQAGMLEIIQQKVENHHVHNVRLLHAGVGSGALEPNYYDRAILVTVLGEIPDQRVALQEIYNALKPGGILSVSEMIFDPHFQPRKAVTALAQSVGFSEKKFFGRWFAYTIQFEK
jgi:ubiquinone/menaquinone biosynthesis C-methylase UbiE